MTSNNENQAGVNPNSLEMTIPLCSPASRYQTRLESEIQKLANVYFELKKIPNNPEPNFSRNA
jgi:hypothetical protein